MSLGANAIQAQETEKLFKVQKRLTELMTHTARLVWLRVQNPAEVEANVCLNCNFMSDEEQVHRPSR